MRALHLLPLIGILFMGCGPEVSAGDPTTGTADTTPPLITEKSRAEPNPTVAPDPAVPSMLLPAVLFSDLDAEVGARMTGVVQRVEVELGDAVREGQVLVVLDDARERARVESASAAVDLARAEFVRTEGLLANGFVTAARMDEAKYRVRSTEGALREAQVELEHTRVTAPFAGVITRRTTGRGRPVRVGEPLFRVTALEPLRAMVRLPERDARGLRRGAAAVLITDDGAQVPARIQQVSPATDPGSGTVEVLLDVPRPGPLRPGSSALARLRRQ